MKKITDWIKNNRILTAAIVIGLIILIIILVKNKNGVKPGPPVEGGSRNLAKCLADKGVKYYGSSTCPKCAQQTSMFGNNKGDLPYVECSANPSECQKQNVKGYPTWKFSDGTELMGVRSLKELQQKAGC